MPFYDEENLDQEFDAGADIEAELAAIKKTRPAATTDGKGILTVDIYQTDDDIVIKSTVAGITGEDIDIAVTNEMVTIKGSRKPDEKVRPNDYYYQELYWGPFSRSIILPEEVDADNAKAVLKNGILTLHLPKLARSKMKRVKIAS